MTWMVAMAMALKRPYVIYPPDYPAARAKTFGSFEAALKAARKIANEAGQAVAVYMRDRSGWRHVAVADPVWRRDMDLRADVDLATAIGLED